VEECEGETERERERERACELGRRRLGGRKDWWLPLVMAFGLCLFREKESGSVRLFCWVFSNCRGDALGEGVKFADEDPRHRLNGAYLEFSLSLLSFSFYFPLLFSFFLYFWVRTFRSLRQNSNRGSGLMEKSFVTDILFRW
jgi:hypothetical protein